jgi:hypothetical protein
MLTRGVFFVKNVSHVNMSRIWGRVYTVSLLLGAAPMALLSPQRILGVVRCAIMWCMQPAAHFF